MSKERQRKLVDQIGWLMVQANADPTILFEPGVDPKAADMAEFFLDDFNRILTEYRDSLSVPQAIRNTFAFAMNRDEIAKIHPDLARQADALPSTRIRSGPGIFEMIQEGKGNDAAIQLTDELLPSRESFLKQKFMRESVAAQAPVFTLPKGISRSEISRVCDDVKLLLECHRQSWVCDYDGSYVPDEDDDPDDAMNEHDHLAFHGSFQWLLNVVEAVREEASKKSGYLNAQCVTKAGPGRFRPPGAVLN